MSQIPPASSSNPARLILVGIRGFGKVRAEHIVRLSEQGRCQLVAAVDPGQPAATGVAHGAPLYAELDQALAASGRVDAVVIAAPLAAHASLAETALRAGADVYLEKPPVASMVDFERLLELERETGRVVQVGFHRLGAEGGQQLCIDACGIGDVVSVGAVGSWSRSAGYWSRSPWAGRRTMAGEPVVDGVVTHSLAHAVATALALAGAERVDQVSSVETDLYRANDIDSDDTSVVRVTSTRGVKITCALTLCAPIDREPEIRIEGTQGRAVLYYTSHRLKVEASETSRSHVLSRVDLLENLLAHRRRQEPLLVPLVNTGAFMRVLDAVARAAEPLRIDPHGIAWAGEGPERHPVVDGIDDWLDRAVSNHRTFAELGVPWAHTSRDDVLLRAEMDGEEVAQYRNGSGTIPTSSPRPVLHPVRTRGGVVVTAQHPADHDWHAGVGMGMPDVNGSNFWGGPTYVRGKGYTLLEDHGRIVGDVPAAQDDGFRQQLRWVGADGAVVLTEERAVSWHGVDQAAWQLRFRSELRTDRGAVFNSPASKGRFGGGYGGFFWRLPECSDVEVFTADAAGEDEVHGQVTPWIAWSAEFAAAPGQCGPATVVLVSPAGGNGWPWFVRAHDYPGLGIALAWDQPLVLAPGELLALQVEMIVSDGRAGRERCQELADKLTAGRRDLPLG